MDYHEATNFLAGLRRFRPDPGTEAVEQLLEHLGDPREDVTFVQVAGSNGKGSVARMTAAVLRETDRRVGLYTSPHFEDLRERVRVDGRKIPESSVTAFVERARPWLLDRAAAGNPLTRFEVLTAMALWRFGEADVDVAVLEVGIGGRFDATSVVDPTASAVTNAALEHTSVLGDSVPEIARSLAPVAPADRPLVTAATGEALDTLRAETGALVTVGRRPETGGDPGHGDSGRDRSHSASSGSNPTVTATYEGTVSHHESSVTVAGDGWEIDARLPVIGPYQAENAGVATVLVRQLGVTDTRTIQRGLRNAHWPGRFEVVETEPTVVLDGAHNPAACAALADTVADVAHDDLHVVFGAMDDKDHREMVAQLPPATTVRTCQPDDSRAENAAALARVFESATDAEVTVGDSVVGALAATHDRAADDDVILLTGSLHCVAEARPEWTRTVTRKQVADAADARELLSNAHVAADEIERTAGDVAHRVVETTLAGERAQVLREAMLSAGGACAVSDFERRDRIARVVLAGTLGEFETLLADLRDRGREFVPVADDIAATLPLAGDESPEATYPWEDGTAVMGVLNVTPDSFHDGGEYYDVADAVAGANTLVDAGVDIVDVGGESTRPGADPVPVEEEIERIVPVIEAIADANPDALLSVDTRKPAVAEAALDAGADVLNDVTGLSDPAMRFLAAERDVPVMVMHSIDAPVVPDREVTYDDVVRDVVAELRERVLLAEEAGVDREKIVVDPGLGFGKTAAESFELLGRLDELHALGCPVLVGHSHKSMFEFVDGETGDALPETIAGTAVAAANGADVVRVHDARENVQAVRVAAAAADPDGFAASFHEGDETDDDRESE
ncbi:MAG: dihydropteroate synthase [Halobaculum sp.]